MNRNGYREPRPCLNTTSANNNSMIDQRRFERSPSDVQVEISHPSLGTFRVKARDLSDGGLFVYMGSHTSPPVGTVVQVRIGRHTGMINAEPVAMRVVHQQRDGIGLSFGG